MLRLLLICASTVALAASAAMAQDAKTATATFISKAGKESGTAKLTGIDKGVLIELDVNGLPAGQWVAFHVHETGSCDHAGGHMSAGGHFNPGKAAHGFNDAKGPHAGDMPNLHIPQGGTLVIELVNSAIALDKGKPNSVFQPGGTALIIHAGKDDYKTDPTGEAGGRIACGVIE